MIAHSVLVSIARQRSNLLLMQAVMCGANVSVTPARPEYHHQVGKVDVYYTS